jgi:phage shock protein A
MSLWSRLKLIFRSKASRALDRAEDPRETLDYSYERQLELLQEMRRGIADVATARKRIELQAQQLQQSATKLEAQARQAIGQNREDLARQALTRRAGIRNELTGLEGQHQQLKSQEERLVEGSRHVEARIKAFRTQKETMKAQYSASEAQARVAEAATGLSEEMSELGLAMQRAEDKIAQAQARAGALDELMASGALDDLSISGDRIQAELDALAADSEVEAELHRLKGETAGGGQKALEAPHSEIIVERDRKVPSPEERKDRS